ncbi:phage portal protein [Salmonella enterica]|nr:phage portal protein [Salmonella enterica]
MLIDAIFRSNSLENPAVPITVEAAENEGIFNCDVIVNPRTAMKLAAVYACIYVISSNVAQMPLHVMRRTGKKVEAARDHPAFYLVHDEPNTWQTSYKWRELKQRHILGWGNGFTRVIRHRRTGEVTGLEACMPWETTLLNTTLADVIPTVFITKKVLLPSILTT